MRKIIPPVISHLNVDETHLGEVIFLHDGMVQNVQFILQNL